MSKSKISPIDHHIAQRLRSLRKECGFTQEKLGRCVGVSAKQIRKYEKAENKLAGSILYSFSRALKVDMDYFYQGLEAPDKKTADRHIFTLEEEKTVMLRQFLNIKDRARRNAFLSLIKAIAKSKDIGNLTS